jgi:hypothetical protein
VLLVYLLDHPIALKQSPFMKTVYVYGRAYSTCVKSEVVYLVDLKSLKILTFWVPTRHRPYENAMLQIIASTRTPRSSSYPDTVYI